MRPTSPTQIEVAKTVERTIASVLSRPRFKIEVGEAVLEPGSESQYTLQGSGSPGTLKRFVTKDGFSYVIRVYPGRKTTVITVMSLDQDKKRGSSIFFSKTIQNNDLPNLRKLGTTLANKIRMRVVYEVMAD